MFDEIPELKAPKGKFRLVGIDRFEIPGEGHFVIRDYDSFDDARQEAKCLNHDALDDSTDASLATVYYVYDENGFRRG